MRSIIRLIDKICKPLIWLSILLYFVELYLKTENSLQSPAILLYLERFVAGVFIIEYILRILEDKLHPDHTQDFCVYGYGGYASSAIGIIDFLSFAPFIVGFFVPIQYLAIIRSLRIIRLFKFFRYSRDLQLVALAFYRVLPELKSMMFVFVVLALFNAALIHEIEKVKQPETFGHILNCLWYVLVSATTVGYGDMFPQTPLGKVVASVTLLAPTIMIYAGIIGVVGSSFTKVVTEEIDPNIDPIDLFKKEWIKKNG